MMDFIKDNYKQLVFLLILVAITGYAMFIGEMTMLNSILTAVLAVLDVGSMINKKE